MQLSTLFLTVSVKFGVTVPKQSVGLPTIRELEILHDRVLSKLKLGKQASGYKTAHKVLNRFIAELIGLV
ncbi:MAG: hypothetical protein RM368_28265 [Nostoc sp. DedSLP03]|uniref:hypothetical protein n=1 Tax=Nostoc sp. DedSLP03 TaxID=3075400 RepID=UPI002AD52C02|nr:hypothetical protein [Nostoc sp. DedSLP03]MDZ7968798.1 hypothetical protein [Nostoc sp. DedSLP03]